MLKTTRHDKRTNLEKEIDAVLLEMKSMRPSSEEYSEIVKNLAVLYKAKGDEPKRGVSADAILTVGGSLLGIVLILVYEKADIITSKALGFVLKGRV